MTTKLGNFILVPRPRSPLPTPTPPLDIETTPPMSAGERESTPRTPVGGLRGRGSGREGGRERWV